MLQLLYVSSAKKEAMPIDLETLLAECERNNSRDEVTGMMFTDGRRFLQVLEGPKATVEDTFLRIMTDKRHHAVVLLSRREIARREFGEWSMALRATGEEHDAFAARAAALCESADPAVQGIFAGLIDTRRAN